MHDKTKVLLTFDLEYCDDIVGLSSIADETEEINAAYGCDEYISLCGGGSCQGIVFVTGEYCKNNSKLIKKLDALGFMIGSHSYSHADMSEKSPVEFCVDTNDSLKLISDTLGKPILAYRAPGFRLPLTAEYYAILQDAGIMYDFSQVVVPTKHNISNPFINKMFDDQSIKIIPHYAMGLSPFYRSGGGNFRISSKRRIFNLIRQFEMQTLYLHPRDMLGWYVARNALFKLKLKEFIFNSVSLGDNKLKLKYLLESPDIRLLSVQEYVENFSGVKDQISY